MDQLRLLLTLFRSPRDYYARHAARHTKAFILLATLLYGMALAQDQLENRITRALARGQDVTEAPFLGSIITSHLHFYAYLLVAGLIGALFFWFVGGWWYNLRIRMSGAKGHSEVLGKFVYFSSSLVLAVPQVLVLALLVPSYPDYLAYSFSRELLAVEVILAIFGLMSCWASYVGVTTYFQVRPERARIWFLILPALLYLIAVLVAGDAWLSWSDDG